MTAKKSKKADYTMRVRVTVDAKAARAAMRRVYRAVDNLIKAQNEVGAAIKALTTTPVGWNANAIHVGAGAKRRGLGA